MHCVPSPTMPKRNVEHVPPLLALTNDFSFVSPLHQRLEWKGSVAGRYDRMQSACWHDFAGWLSLVCPSGVMDPSSHVYCPSCSPKFSNSKLKQFPLLLSLRMARNSSAVWVSDIAVYTVSLWLSTPAPSHNICTLCRSTLLHSLVRNSCATLTVSCSILYTL